MTVIETKLRKWGNSFGAIIPMDIVQRDNMKENQNIRIVLIKDGSKILQETFGMGKGKLTKSGQQIKDELRRELYNN